MRERGCDPAFLLFEDSGMVEYCRKRKLAFDARFALVPLGRVPLVSHFVRERAVFRMLNGFLDEVRPVALVGEPIVPQRVRALFERARTRGVRTLALQWALHSTMAPHRSALASRVLALRDQHSSLARGVLYELYLLFLASLFRLADAFRGKEYFMHADTHVDRLGVIDEASGEALLGEGWKREHIRVVGYAEFTIVAELVRRIHADENNRAALCGKYGLTPGRKKILVLSTPFYSGRNAVFLDREGQRKYFGKIFEDIRSVFSPEEADILFKLHPREQDMYGSDLGIRIFHNEADLYELIVLSDLYVAHPLTAANFILRASATPAIFVNFTPLEYMDVGRELYKLRDIEKTHEAFRTKLKRFRDGALPLQYDASDVGTDSLEKIADFITGRNRD